MASAPAGQSVGEDDPSSARYAARAGACGTLCLAFLAGVFAFAPAELPLYKQQVLAVISSLLAGSFGYFITGSLRVRLNLYGVPLVAEGTGGLAAGLLVLAWWWTPWTPVRCRDHEARDEPPAWRADGPIGSEVREASR